MKRTATCTGCSHDFKVDSEKIKPGQRLPCPLCDSNSYFKVPADMEEIEVQEVKG